MSDVASLIQTLRSLPDPRMCTLCILPGEMQGLKQISSRLKQTFKGQTDLKLVAKVAKLLV